MIIMDVILLFKILLLYNSKRREKREETRILLILRHTRLSASERNIQFNIQSINDFIERYLFFIEGIQVVELEAAVVVPRVAGGRVSRTM